MISVENVSKVFKIPHQQTKTLFHKLLFFSNRGYTYEKLYALKDVSLRVKSGECLGIIGKNGSGKSTLLRIIAGIYRPTTGKVMVNEDISPLLELGLGFDPNFSCKDNIYVYGALLGFSREQMSTRVGEILAFAELERFEDAKLDTLSSGMRMRLAFSIAIQSVAPVILVDEVLAVGDKVFAEKCTKIFRKFRNEGRTVVLVSHSMASITEFCDRVIILHSGRIIAAGAPDVMVQLYNEIIVPTPEDQIPDYQNQGVVTFASGLENPTKLAISPSSYRPMEFWEKRLRRNFNLSGVGNIMFSERYNGYLYDERCKVLDQALKKYRIILEGREVLDVGCGTGFFTRYYLERNARVTGIDIAPVVINHLTNSTPDARILLMNVTNDQFKTVGQFDIIHFFSTAFHITDDNQFRVTLRNLAGALKVGGYLFITDCFPAQTISPAPHVKFRSMKEYRVLEEAGLTIVDLLNIHYSMNRKLWKLSVGTHEIIAPVLTKLDTIKRRIGMNNRDNLKLLVVKK